MRAGQQGFVGAAGARPGRGLPRLFVAGAWTGGLALSGVAVWLVRDGLWATVLAELLCLSLMLVIWLLLAGRARSRALAVERDRLDSVVLGTNAGSWEWNCQTGEARFNARWAEILGESLADLPLEGLETWRSRVHPDDLPGAQAALQRHLDGATPLYEAEMRMRHRSGRWVWVISRGKLYSRTADGRPLWVAGAHMDISERHQFEDDMRASELMLDRAGRMAGVGGWELDLATGLVHWSDQTCRIHDLQPGYQPARGEQMSFFSADDQARLRQMLTTISEGGPQQELELPMTTALGRYVWVRIVGEALAPAKPGQPIRRLVGSVQDITERRALAEATLRSNAVMRSIIDNMPCGLCVYDGDHRMVAHNEQFKRLLRLPDSFFENGEPRFEDLIEFNARRGEYGEGASAQSEIQRFLDFANGPTDYAFEVDRPDGSSQEVHAAALPGGGFIVTYVDLSDRKRGERLLRGAMDAIDEALVLFDPDDRLVYCNAKHRELFANVSDLLQPGVTFEAILRARIERDPDHDAHGNEEAWIAERLAQHRGDVRQVHRTRDNRWMRLMEKTMPDGHIVAFRVDITDMLRATDAAEKASVAKSQFLANMSHEIRTPMNAVLGMLKLLQKTPMTTRQQDYVAKTEGAARSLLGLLNDILDFSKVEAGKMSLDPHPMRFDELLRDMAVILAANVARQDVEVLFDVDPALPRCVIADAMRLQQVLINLAGNAIKFTKVGEVVIALKLVALEEGAVSVDFIVRDTGIGIAPEHQERIFGGFTQAEASTTRRFGGTGLGLAISQRLVQMMGSELRLESELGKGSRFFFRLRLGLPQTAELAGAERAATADSADPAPATRSLRALLVDDNAAARELLGGMAASLGWQVDVAESGAQALFLMREALASGQDYEVVLIDWNMPGMDGWETSRGLRSLTRGRGSLPLLVMVTAHGREMLAQRSEREQGLLDGFLVKPVTASMLLSAVSDARAATRPGELDDRPESPGESTWSSSRQLPAPPSARRLAGLRLLVVEDNVNNQQVARELLEDEGAAVLLAADGQQALSLLAHAKSARHGDRIDAVLMDVQMPVMDGYTATRLIRRQLRMTLPIIAMTANARASDRQACLDVGMSEHVGKPFDIDHLVGVLVRHCGVLAGPPGTTPARAVSAPTHLPMALLEQARTAGIELGEALGRMSGKVELFKRTVAALDEAAQALPEPLTASALHGLRGLAATLGARSLADLAAVGERALQEGAGLPQGWQARFDAALERDLAVLGELAGQLPSGAPPLRSGGVLAPDLIKLIELLDGSDMAALDAFTRLQSTLQQERGPVAGQLESALAELDFAGAAGHCRALLRELAA